MPYEYLRTWLLPFIRRRISVVGLENLPRHAGGFLIAANHNAWVDTPLLAGALYRSLDEKLYFIARSRHYASLGAITIDPEHPSGVIRVSLDYLQRGHPVVVFPEGRSNSRRTLDRPKTGLARLAHLSGVPIVPVGIRGTFGVSALFSILCFFLWFRRITIHLGPPQTFPKLPANGITKELLEKTSNDIMEMISGLSDKPFSPQ